MRYERLAFLILFIMLSLSGLTAAQSDTVELIIWGQPHIVACINQPNTDPACEYARWIDAAFEAAHPDIRLNWQDRGSGELLYLNLTNETLDETPDIIVSDLFIPALAATGYLDPIELPQNTLDSFIPEILPATTHDDQVYGVMANTNLFTLEVNPSLITKSGLDIDTVNFERWENVIETAAIVTENSGGSYGFVIVGASELPSITLSYAAPFIYIGGEPLCNEGCTEPVFNGQESDRGYGWMNALYNQSPPEIVFSGDVSYVLNQITTDYIAMQIAPTHRISNAACPNCIYYPLPHLADTIAKANSLVDSAIYGITRDSAHKEAATIFVQWLAEDDVQLASFWYGGHLPVTSSALNALVDVTNGTLDSVPPSFEGNAEDLVRLYMPYIDPLMTGHVAAPPTWHTNALELNTLWNEMFVTILNTDISTVGAVLNDYQNRAMEIINP